jgi:uncharacterized protein (DUF58 family)
MERWLSKSRVLLGLCGVLLVAALNRQDPMVYGMFLMLVVVSFLGFLLPWLSLRSMTVRLATTFEKDVMEGEGCDLGILVERTASWPAFMVDIETEWEWGSQRMVLRQTVSVIRRGRMPELSRLVQFPCRGNYELVAVRLSSGFPLGLMRAQYTLSRPNIHVRVLPQAQTMHWPLPWDVADDPLGELTTRRMGQSFELGMLRPYQYGESVGRVSWRASARVGELVIQHFKQSGSIRLRVVLDVPREPALGDPDSAGEQAVRLAAGVGDAALSHGAQLYLYLQPLALTVLDGDAVRQALATAEPTGETLLSTLAQVAQDTAPGEQVAVVVSGEYPGAALLASLAVLTAQGCHVVVSIATGRRASAADRTQATSLRLALEHAGFTTFMEAP